MRAVADAPAATEIVVGPTSAPDDVLRVEHVAKSFGPITAVRDINLHLRKERVHRPLPLLANRQMKRDARTALDEIGIHIPRIDVSVARLSGGQRQAIAVARTVNSDADILLLDEPLAAMGAKEGAQILDLVARLKAEGRVSIIMILHNYVQVFQACDRVSMIQDGVIALDKPTNETSVEELTEIVVNEYRRARAAAHAAEE